MIAERTAPRRESGVGRPDLFELVVRTISLIYAFPKAYNSLNWCPHRITKKLFWRRGQYSEILRGLANHCV